MNKLKNIEQLKREFRNKIPYNELLCSKEWISKRKEILKRDDFKCQQCYHEGVDLWDESIISYHVFRDGMLTIIYEDEVIYAENGLPIAIKPSHSKQRNKLQSLHIHHKCYYYDLDKRRLVFPWDYKDSDLITLCVVCHKKIHQNQKINIYTKQNSGDIDYEFCSRCSGLGYIAEFSHYKDGICFKCNGDRIFFNHITHQRD